MTWQLLNLAIQHILHKLLINTQSDGYINVTLIHMKL